MLGVVDSQLVSLVAAAYTNVVPAVPSPHGLKGSTTVKKFVFRLGDAP